MGVDMNIYSDLLAELGFDLPKEEVDLKISDHEDWNEEDWTIAAELGTVSNFKLDWDQEQQRDWRKRHRYCRRGRFIQTLYQILNIRGTVSMRILADVKRELISSPILLSKRNIWLAVRRILKRKGYIQFYNQIPAFIKYSTGVSPKVTNDQLLKVIRNFERMHYQFDNLAKEWKRKYFLSMRYVCLKLLEKEGMVFPYRVPKLMTSRKRYYLNYLFSAFCLE